MTSDALSEVFDLIEIQGVMTGGFTVTGSWVARGALTLPLEFIAIARGTARVATNNTPEPFHAAAGDVIIFNNQSWLEVHGGPPSRSPHQVDVTRRQYFSPLDEGADTIIGGHIDLNAIGQELLWQALPAVGHIRAAETDLPLRTRIDHLVHEVTSDRIGSTFAARQQAQLLLLDMLRVYLGQADLPPGWLRLLTDERLLPAVTLMHAQPEKPWRVETLAHAAAMSRAGFAARFKDTAGVPPLTYLSRWRTLLAQRALREEGDTSIAAIAVSLGFGSASAFSTAFKRNAGEPPLRFRHRSSRESGR